MSGDVSESILPAIPTSRNHIAFNLHRRRKDINDFFFHIYLIFITTEGWFTIQRIRSPKAPIIHSH